MADIQQVDFGNVSDIPEQMEAMAAQLRAGDHEKIRFAVCVFLGEGGIPVVCGWGQEADYIHAIGLLHLGASWLAQHEVKRR